VNTPVSVPFVDLGRQYASLRDEILRTIDDVLRSGQYILGPEVDHFEAEAAQFCGSQFAVGVANGSDSLWLSMKCLGIGAGDEVITAPNSFIASAWAIAAVGATPRFSDVDETLNLDPSKLESAITPKTKAIMPVHLTGRVANMEVLLDVARRHKLHVIEDAAQAIGASRHGKKAGSFGTVGSFSLHPLKNLAAFGDGGLVTTDNAELASQLRLMRNHGLKTRDESVIWGYNSRLDAVQAAVLRIKLRHLSRWNAQNRNLGERYNNALARYVHVPRSEAGEEQIYHRYVIQTDRRNELQSYLAAKGIDTKVNYPTPIHLQEASASLGYKRGDFPVAEKLADRILSLPLYPEFTNAEQDRVIAGIEDFFAGRP
jgi:dTDP-4-amino-4,6-dideoxygalactose transaminase